VRSRPVGIAWRTQAAVAAGGSVGALARVAVEREFPVHPGAFPWSTFVINVVGCVLLAYVATRLMERLPPSTYRRPAIGTGFCGALTTFSTLQVELFTLLRDGDVVVAVVYAASSIAIGFAAVILATWMVRRARLVRSA
jgi:fluoride exporter